MLTEKQYNKAEIAYNECEDKSLEYTIEYIKQATKAEYSVVVKYIEFKGE